jgi:FkbM family methyltransferase
MQVNTGSGGRGGGSGGSSSSKGSSSSASDPGPAAVKSVCENTCTGFAKNGVCDEGRPNAKATLETQPDSAAIFEVQCDLGTDCDDCGPWVHTNTDASDSWRPIAEIREKKFEIYTRQSAHPTAYFMAFTDGQKDVDVSAHMWANRIFEPMYTYAWHTLLSAGCRGPGGERRLVVDVGANFGYYSLLAASMGCRVVAWEPVPFFAAYFKYGLLRNNLTNLVELRERIVSNSTGGELTIVVPNRGIWGTAGIDGSNIDGAIENEGEYDKVVRPVERVDEVVKEDVLIMKASSLGVRVSISRAHTRSLKRSTKRASGLAHTQLPLSTCTAPGPLRQPLRSPFKETIQGLPASLPLSPCLIHCKAVPNRFSVSGHPLPSVFFAASKGFRTWYQGEKSGAPDGRAGRATRALPAATSAVHRHRLLTIL